MVRVLNGLQDINFAPYGFPEVGNLPKDKGMTAPVSPARLGGASVFTPSPVQRAQVYSLPPHPHDPNACIVRWYTTRSGASVIDCKLV
jgi:hypothetical protein